MSTITLNPSKDVHLTKILPTSNQDATNLDVGENFGTTDDVRRALIKFDLSSLNGAIINSATLRMYDTGTDLTNNTRTMKVYRLLRDWGETTATWNTYDGSNNWGTAGASNTSSDREATDIGSVSMVNPPSAAYSDITLTASKVQEWVNGTLTNNGFILVMDTETDDLHRFDSSEGSNQPQLVIDYSMSGFFALL